MKKVAIAIATLPLVFLAACGSETEQGQISKVASVVTSVIPKNEFIEIQERCEPETNNRSVFDYSEAGISGTVFAGYSTFEEEIFYCVLSSLEPNNILISQIEQTTAMMGIQKYEDNKTGNSFMWSYHPDNGLYLAVEKL